MDFLMDSFRKCLESYGYKFSLMRIKNKHYVLEMRDLPSDLDYECIRLKYEGPSECFWEDDKPVQKTTYIDIFRSSRKNGINIVTATFDENDYAIKINKIDHMLREYIGRQHQ